jgi:hypothetical protein
VKSQQHPLDPAQRIWFVQLERVSASGSGPGGVGLSLSKADISDPFVVNDIEPDVCVCGGLGLREAGGKE